MVLKEGRPSVSVVMPYYENSRTLPACLSALAAQTLAPYEVIVVDDGSKHQARDVVRTAGFNKWVRVYDGAHRGQSAATNTGIRAATGEVILLTCSDIIADENLLALHTQAHLEACEPIAVLGNIPYAKTVPSTPFMRYLALPGPQFNFAAITNPQDAPYVFFYAPNASVQRHILLQIGLFDEAFIYGYQDTDLGCRLHSAGVRMVYREAAIGWHDHPNSLRAFVARQQSVGVATLRMLRKYPNAKRAAYLRDLVIRLQPMQERFEKMLVDTEALETKLQASAPAYASLRQRLHGLYDTLINIALVRGMLTQHLEAVELLQLQDAPCSLPT